MKIIVRESSVSSTAGQLLRNKLRERRLSQQEREKSATVGKDRYPIPDKKHAALAKAFINKGGLSKSEKAKVVAKANRELGEAQEPLGEPFASKAQQRFAFGTHQPWAKEFADATPNIKGLPQKVSVKSKEAARERLTFHPMLREATSFDDEKRVADVIIITDGKGNSDDNHFYFPETIQEAVRNKVFDSAQAFVDHPTLDEDVIRPERSVRDLVGYYFGSRLTEVTRDDGSKGQAYAAKMRIFDGPAYDWVVSLLKESIRYKQLFPQKNLLGLSINADGDIQPETVGGETVKGVRKITKPFSADIVTKPARGGQIVALRESCGSRRINQNGEEKVSKLLEAAKRIEEQLASGEIEKDDLALMISEIQNTEKVRESKSKESAKESAKESDGSDMREARVKEDAADGDGADDEPDGDEDEAQPKGKSKESAREAGANEPELTGKNRESERHSNDEISKRYPGVWKAALREAESKIGNDVQKIKDRVAELETEKVLRESSARAERKLKESGLPAPAAERLANYLVGEDDTTQDRLIEAEVKYHKELGINFARKVEGAGANNSNIKLRESEGKENASCVFAGMGDE